MLSHVTPGFSHEAQQIGMASIHSYLYDGIFAKLLSICERFQFQEHAFSQTSLQSESVIEIQHPSRSNAFESNLRLQWPLHPLLDFMTKPCPAHALPSMPGLVPHREATLGGALAFEMILTDLIDLSECVQELVKRRPFTG